jgi:copper chaperone CopZ
MTTESAATTSAKAMRTVRLAVPGLVERPAVGTSCCASTAEAIVAQELSMLLGVADVVVDCAVGTVEVTHDAAVLDQQTIEAALEEIGYPVSAEDPAGAR